MIMWIAAIVLVAMTVSLGYRQGAIRAAFTFLGLLIAAVLARPMAPLFNFIFNFINVHPAAPQFITPVIAFLVVSIVFTIAGAFVFKKVDYHYRYNVSDAYRAFWERMHRRVGAAVGVLNGIVYFIVFALVVAVAGYFTIQTGGDESGSKVLWFVTKAANDLKDTRMDRVVAPFNPAPDKYMEISDLLGLLYHNRELKGRLENYPVFAAMAEKPVFHDIGSDAAAQKALSSGNLNEILDNPKIQEVVTNTEIYNEFLSVDLEDLRKYLETGVSPKFAEQDLLGRWMYDEAATIQLNKRLQPDMPASKWARLKRELSDRYDDTMLTALYNNKAMLKLGAKAEGKASPLRPIGATKQGQTNYAALWWNTNATYSATGNWSGSSPSYLISLGNKNGKKTAEAKIVNKDRLFTKFEDTPMAFQKIPD